MTFQRALKESDVPEGQVRKARIGNKDFALIRSQGAVYCIEGTCTHEGGPLGEGSLKDGWLECPWHEGHFDYKSGKTDPETDWVTPVKPFKTKLEGGYVWIDL